MSAFKNIIYEKKGGVAKITINRPEVRNALNIETRRELKAALEDARAEEGTRVVVITGAGDQAYCAGADLNEFKDMTPMQVREYIRLSRDVTNLIEGMEKPVISAVNGYALGGGCELAMACDIIIASETARFGQPEIRVGLIPGGGATQRLPRHIGVKKAKELILTGDLIAAAEAERLGLVNRVVPADKLNEAVEELVEKLLSKSPVMLGLAKASINKAMEMGLESGLRYELEAFALCFSTEDQKEGVRAFFKKRKPVYKGR
ncbi:MAG: enoyl-CoA hydratase/isomerase family protein [Candidatus Geothermarchaeales archaeon]